LSLTPDLGADKVISTVEVEAGGRDIQIKMEIPGLNKVMQSKILPVSLTAKGPRADLSVNGQADFNQPNTVVEASIKGYVADLTKFSTGVKDLSLPGELTLKSQLKGSTDQLAMEGFSLIWKGPGQSTAKIAGRIENIIKLTGPNLNLL
jgi:hypothetical protein